MSQRSWFGSSELVRSHVLTSYPRFASSRANRDPMKPPPPVTKTLAPITCLPRRSASSSRRGVTYNNSPVITSFRLGTTLDDSPDLSLDARKLGPSRVTHVLRTMGDVISRGKHSF